MIQSIEYSGFKSFVSEIIDFKNLTLLTGLNSSGKSSVIQSILLLDKAVKNEMIYLPGHGSIFEFKNPYTSSMSIKADIEDGAIVIEDDHFIKSNEIKFPEIIYISADRFGPETSMPIFVDGHHLGKKGENVFKCIEYFADFPLPDFLRHEKSEGDTFLFNLRAWLSVITPNVTFKSKIEEIADSSFATFNGYRSKNVGFGLSYTLPVIVALLLGSITENCLVMIENPEAHLHPRGQVEIARLISLCVRSGAQVIIETHSDHLFDGIRIQAKKNITDNLHSKIKIYWFELDNNNNTIVERANVDKDGRLDNWPTGLFDQFGINASNLL
jgi:predicted ATPase